MSSKIPRRGVKESEAGCSACFDWVVKDAFEWRLQGEHMSRLLFGTITLTLAGITAAVAGIRPAPEIDPASALTALTLLMGGLVAIRGRKSKK